MNVALWNRINAAAESAFGRAEKVGLWVWERCGRRPAVVFALAVAHAVGGFAATAIVAHYLWHSVLFPPERLAAMSPDARVLVALLPALAKAGAILSFLALSALFWIWAERKVAGRIHLRHGPMHVGGWHGWAQSIADGIKLLTKEDLVPAGADRRLFVLAPYLVMAAAVAPFLAIPFGFGAETSPLDPDIGLLFIAATLGIEVVGVTLAGWSSDSKWAVFGGLRQAAQVVAYEVPLTLSLIPPVLYAGSLRLTRITAAQNGPVTEWLLFRDPFCLVAFGVFFLAALASCKRAPFDLPEAESELVGGFHTEYSGLRWSFFFLAEYGAMFLVSFVASILWLGGPNIGLWVWADPMPLPFLLLGPLVLVGKASALMFVQMWVRWSLPRLRLDQMLLVCLKYLLPVSLVCILGSAAWKWLIDPVPAPVGWSEALATRGVAAPAFDLLTRLALIGATAAVLVRLGRAAAASRREAASADSSAALGPAWRTWGGRMGAGGDRWSPGYDWADPAHRKPVAAQTGAGKTN
jgi:NADH-quinone oxidoreductase subunit H